MEAEEHLHYDATAGIYEGQTIPAVCTFPAGAKPKALALPGREASAGPY